MAGTTGKHVAFLLLAGLLLFSALPRSLRGPKAKGSVSLPRTST